MSKRPIIFIFLGIVVVLALLLTNFGRNLPFLPFFAPEFTEEIPETRPPRLDRRLLVRFEGMPMERILETLVVERAEAEPDQKPDPDSTGRDSDRDRADARLLASLPDAPLPFPEDAPPRDADHLRSFVTGFQADEARSGQEGKPDPASLRRFGLALAALRISPDQVPDTIRDPGAAPEPEVETLEVSLGLRDGHELSGPFAIGDFNGGGDLEMIDRGGLRMSTLDGSGAPIAIAGSVTDHPGRELAPCDFDGDGDLDLYLARGEGLPDSLLLNEGEGSFRDVTIELGLLAFRDTTAARWLDYDRDGLPDLLVGSSDQPLELYHQTEGGVFQPVAWDLGLWVPRGIRQILVGDFLGDQHPDFFLGIEGMSDRFCRNLPGENWENWRFVDVTAELGFDSGEDGAVALVDMDGDGRLDVARTSPGRNGILVYRNQADGAFVEVGEQVGLADVEAPVSLVAADFDNDGFPDLFCGTPKLSMNRLLWNRGGISFRDISVSARAGYLDEPVALAARDWDLDGAIDLIYRTADGTIRRLEAEGALRKWLLVSLDRSLPGARLVAEGRDSDWIVHRHSLCIGAEEIILMGVGDAKVVESLSLFAPGSAKAPLTRLEKISPGQKVTLELPKQPRRRAVTPLSGPTESN